MPQLLRETFASQRLGRPISYSLYLPDLAPGMREPALVLYLLHGAGGDHKTWTGEDPMLRGPLVNAMLNGTMRPSVLVMPTVGYDNWWTDGVAGPAASALLEELMPRVEARLTFTVPRQRRALLGVSMGGSGALNIALAQPQRFCAAALISPTAYDPLPPPDSVARRSSQFMRDGRFDEQLWQSANYPSRLAAYQAQPTRVAFWIVAGDRDRSGILQAATQLFERLRAFQPGDSALRVISGGHDWTTFDAALPDALGFIDRRCR
jgi:S-formylglutathione hydrolase FrmB